MRKKKISIPLYHGTLVLIQTKNLIKVGEKYKEKITKSYGAVTFSHLKKNGRKEYILAFRPGQTYPSVIAHEATHFVNWVFHDIKADLDIMNDEPQAYLLGWAVRKCHKFLKIKKQW